MKYCVKYCNEEIALRVIAQGLREFDADQSWLEQVKSSKVEKRVYEMQPYSLGDLDPLSPLIWSVPFLSDNRASKERVTELWETLTQLVGDASKGPPVVGDIRKALRWRNSASRYGIPIDSPRVCAEVQLVRVFLSLCVTDHIEPQRTADGYKATTSWGEISLGYKSTTLVGKQFPVNNANYPNLSEFRTSRFKVSDKGFHVLMKMDLQASDITKAYTALLGVYSSKPNTVWRKVVEKLNSPTKDNVVPLRKYYSRFYGERLKQQDIEHLHTTLRRELEKPRIALRDIYDLLVHKHKVMRATDFHTYIYGSGRTMEKPVKFSQETKQKWFDLCAGLDTSVR